MLPESAPNRPRTMRRWTRKSGPSCFVATVFFGTAIEISLTVTDLGGIYRRPHVPSKIRWPQVLFQKQVIAKSLFLDLLTREAGKASHMTVNLSKEPLFEGQTGSSGDTILNSASAGGRSVTVRRSPPVPQGSAVRPPRILAPA